jgi:tetratricopeptide (TPR) repeat protein
MQPAQPHHGQLTQNLRSRANELRKSGEYGAAADIYSKLWPDKDPWIGWSFACCLRKLKRSSEALAVSAEVLKLNPDFELAHSVYAWAVFDELKRTDDPSRELFEHAWRAIGLTGVRKNAYEPLSAFVPLILRAAKALSTKRKFRHVLTWLAKLDDAHLSDGEFSFVDPKGKNRRLASQREKYYSLMTRALELEGRWEECLQIAERGLRSSSPLHHDNEIWFARRAARARVQLGQTREGLVELQKLVVRKPTSFIFNDIANAALKLGDLQLARENALRALQCYGDLDFKLPALLLFARILWDAEERELAIKHLSLYIAYRKTRAWPVRENVLTLASKWDAPIDADANVLLHQLKPVWQRSLGIPNHRRNGVIDTLLPHGKAGFIVGDDHERFYFETRDWKEPRDQIQKGSQVTFATKASFDKKRQRPSTIAYDIRRITKP